MNLLGCRHADQGSDRERAQLAGYTLVDPATVPPSSDRNHKSQAYELLGRQETKNPLDNVARTNPKVVKSRTESPFGWRSAKVLQNLKEKVSIRDAVTILETSVTEPTRRTLQP